MKFSAPDFRNLFTTGNVASVIGAAFVAGTAWAAVNGELKLHNDRLLVVETDVKTMPQIKIDVAVIKNSQERSEKDVNDIKHWLEKLSDKIDRQLK